VVEILFYLCYLLFLNLKGKVRREILREDLIKTKGRKSLVAEAYTIGIGYKI
jgi:hypothetical protein